MLSFAETCKFSTLNSRKDGVSSQIVLVQRESDVVELMMLWKDFVP